MRNFTLALSILLLSLGIMAQAPQAFNYQSVLRNAAGEIMADENAEITIKIKKGSESGTEVFSEIHNVVTNAFGLISLQVGSISSLAGIDWDSDVYFLALYVNGSHMGTSQLLSVPFAMHAQTSADAFSGDYNDLENTPDLSSLISVEDAQTGDMTYYHDQQWVRLPAGTEGQVLRIQGGIPQWSDLPQGGDDDNGDDGTITDIDGNVYPIVQIGNQWWMAANLRTSRYNNGDQLLTGLNNTQWEWATAGAYSIYNDSEAHEEVFGKLYNWKAVMDPRGLCPAGWHVPSDAEWKELEMHLGMTQAQADGLGWRGTDEGGKLKATGTDLWNSPNTGATNESGFTAIPGGARTYLGEYIFLNEWSYFWTTTVHTEDYSSYYRVLAYNEQRIFRIYNHHSTGMAVRCVKND